MSKSLVTLGMFIIDEFSFTDLEGNTVKASTSEVSLLRLSTIINSLDFTFRLGEAVHMQL